MQKFIITIALLMTMVIAAGATTGCGLCVYGVFSEGFVTGLFC